MICQCFKASSYEKGYVRREDGVWVHQQCRMPTALYFEGEQDEDMNAEKARLNLFRYGDHHNELHSAHDLIHGREPIAWLSDYVWTPEIVVGSLTGTEARVWVHRDHLE